MSTSQRLSELTRDESLRLLSSASFGRIVFTNRALPAVRLVRHLVANGDIIIRSPEGAGVVTASDASRGVVVAYETDVIDPAGHGGWSVIVTGTARLISDPDQVARCQRALPQWVPGAKDQFIGIQPEIITGFRLDSDDSTAARLDGYEGIAARPPATES